MEVNVFEKDKNKYPELKNLIRVKSPVKDIDVEKSIDVYDSMSGFRSLVGEPIFATVVGERIEKFRNRLTVVNRLSLVKDENTSVSFIQPIEPCSLLFLEDIEKNSYFDFESNTEKVMSVDGFVLTTVRSNFLTVEVQGHTNKENGQRFCDSLALFYPYTEYAVTKIDVCSFTNVLAYLDMIGVDRSMCNFIYHDMGEQIWDDSILKSKSVIDQAVLFRSENGNIQKSVGGELTFNNFQVYQDVFKYAPFRAESWFDCLGNGGLEHVKYNLRKGAKISATIAF